MKNPWPSRIATVAIIAFVACLMYVGVGCDAQPTHAAMRAPAQSSTPILVATVVPATATSTPPTQVITLVLATATSTPSHFAYLPTIFGPMQELSNCTSEQSDACSAARGVK